MELNKTELEMLVSRRAGLLPESLNDLRACPDYYPVVDREGKLTGDVVAADESPGYEVSEDGLYVIEPA